MLALAALAAGILLLELDLIRIFSFTIWHHFTFMVVSVALLGFGVSGVVLQVRPALGEPVTHRAAFYASAFSLTAIVAVVAITRIPLDPTRIASEPFQLVRLFAYYALLVIPFGFAGMAVGTLLKGFAAQATRLYAADLVGAGIACIGISAALYTCGAEGVLLLAAALAMLAAFLLERTTPDRRAGPHRAYAVGAVALLALIPWSATLMPIPPGPSKAMARYQLDASKFPDARIVYTRWSALGRVDVVENTGTVRWTMNPIKPVAAPRQTQIVIDGDAATPVVETSGADRELAFLDSTLSSAGLQVFRPEKVLVIGAGGGVDVRTALRTGAKSVDAVEINPVIVDLTTGRLAERGGRLFSHPGVELHNEEGRAFLRGRNERYGAIVLSLIDTWAASASGAYSLAEGYLYTVEAFREYLDHLEPDGFVVISRWGWNPPRETLRLCTIAVEAMRRDGVTDPRSHVVVLSLANLGSVIVKRTPFTPSQIGAFRRLADARGFSFMYAPGITAENAFFRFLESPDPDGFTAGYPYDIRPVTDDSPFFFQFGRWRDANPFGRAWDDSPLVLSGKLVLLAVLLQASVLSLLLLVAPLMLDRSRARDAGGPPPGRVVAYFFLIGLSFMLLEIVLMQRFALFLGSPVRATGLVLATILVAAGVGSALGSRIAPEGRRPTRLFVAIAALAALYAVLLPAIFRATFAADLTGRSLVSIALLAPLGFVLGVPFPVAIERLSRAGATGLVGWAWASNGCASVVGPIVAVLLAMDVGFTAVTLLGAVGYLGAYVSMGRHWTANG